MRLRRKPPPNSSMFIPRWGARPRSREARADDAASFAHHSGQSPLYPKVMAGGWLPVFPVRIEPERSQRFPCIVAPFEAKSAAAFAESALMGEIKEGGDSRERHRENSERACELDEIAHVLTISHRRLLYCRFGRKPHLVNFAPIASVAQYDESASSHRGPRARGQARAAPRAPDK